MAWWLDEKVTWWQGYWMTWWMGDMVNGWHGEWMTWWLMTWWMEDMVSGWYGEWMTRWLDDIVNGWHGKWIALTMMVNERHVEWMTWQNYGMGYGWHGEWMTRCTGLVMHLSNFTLSSSYRPTLFGSILHFIFILICWKVFCSSISAQLLVFCLCTAEYVCLAIPVVGPAPPPSNVHGPPSPGKAPSLLPPCWYAANPSMW